MSARRCAWTAAALALAASVAAAPAVDESADARHAAWRWRRALTLPAAAPHTTSALGVPPELYVHASGDLRDLRLVDAQGHDVPYVVDHAQRPAAPEWSGRLSDVRREEKQLSQWQVDLGELRVFEQVVLDVPGHGFAKRARLEASDDGHEWRLLRDDAGIFERDWNGPLRHTTLDLELPARARYLRLTLDDRRSAPVHVTSLRVRGLRAVGERRWSLAAPLVPGTAAPGHSRWRLDLPAGLPLDRVTLDAADPTFSRQARLVEVTPRDGRRDEQVRGAARAFRVHLDDAAPPAESLRLDVQRPGRGELWLEVDDGDSPPLRAPSVRVSGPSERLLFPTGSGAVALYYGNERTRSPLYDLEALRGQLSAVAADDALLGAEEPNPQHSPAPPLAFVPSAGAPLDASRWRALRRLTLGPAEDIFSLLLTADDLGRLRDDLGDLRLADAQDRQVPYILEPNAADARLALSWSAETPRAARGETRAPAPSRYRLEPAPAGDDAARRATRPRGLPLAALELDFREVFFARPARLLADAPHGAGEQTLWAGQLTRTAEPPRAPLSLALDGRRHAVLALEIDEGDNAALTLTSAQAVVRVARVTFKAAPGEYRLLLGNEEAGAPRYDLDALRRDVLAYSALPAQAGALEDNPAFRRRAADYFRSAPPTIVMWAALLLAVVALVLLTVRILRKSEA